MIVKIPVFLSTHAHNKAHFLVIGYEDKSNTLTSLNEAGKALAYLIYKRTGYDVRKTLTKALQEIDESYRTGNFNRHAELLHECQKAFEKFVVDDRSG